MSNTLKLKVWDHYDPERPEANLFNIELDGTPVFVHEVKNYIDSESALEETVQAFAQRLKEVLA